MTYKITWRDRVAYWLARASLSLATKEYRSFVTVVSRLGMERLPGALTTEHLEDAISDLHSVIGADEWKQLDEMTRDVCKDVHTRLHHPELLSRNED